MSPTLDLFSMCRILTLALLLITADPQVFSQTAPIPFHSTSLSLHSGVHDGRRETVLAKLVWSEDIVVAHAPWLRVRFAEYNLGSESYVRITSLLDGSSQRLNAVRLSEWYNTSAFFNGDAVRIELFVAPSDVRVFVDIDEMFVGEYQNEYQAPQTICGTSDDRTASNMKAIGRIVSVGCTGWIVSNGLHVTAGHCVSGGTANVLQFNVPSSLADGTIQNPPAEDQYSIVQTTINSGSDWAVFEVYDNSETELQPIEAQEASLSVVQDLDPDELRVTGHGVDGPSPDYGAAPPRNSDSQTQQTHLGSNASSSGTTMRYTADTQGGNSGSPIIDETTGQAVGVHTNGGCSTSGGFNSGTSTYESSFWNALNPPASFTVDQQRLVGTRISGSTIGRWNGSIFTEITIPIPPNPLPTINTTLGAREVLRGHQQIVTNPSEKYRVWERNQVAQLDTVQNHRGFSVLTDVQNLTSRFNLTDPTITIKNDLLDAPGTTGGDVQFIDPWYIDFDDPEYGNNRRNRGQDEAYPHARPSPFNPDYTTEFDAGKTYKGVFLNQSGPAFNWAPPYYLVGAPSPQQFTYVSQTYDANFASWGGTGVAYQNFGAAQTGVVFQTSNAVATALYKAHLASSTTNALANTQQRKIIRAWSGVYYACYESAGHIWILRSSDNGVTWSPEQQVSDQVYGFTNRNPSISMLYTVPNRVLVAWEANGASGGNVINKVYLRKVDPDNLSNITHTYLATTQSSSQFSTMPVVAPRLTPTSNHSLLAWYDPSGTGQIRCYVVTTAQTDTLFKGYPGQFTLSPNTDYYDPWRLAMANGSVLMYRVCDLNQSNQIVRYPVETVTSNGGGISSPSLVDLGSAALPGICWFEDNNGSSPSGSVGAIRFEQRTATGWDGVVTVWPVNTASVASMTYNSNKSAVSMYWTDGTLVRRSDRINGVWSGVSALVTGSTPSASVSVPGHLTGSPNEIILSRSNSSLYRIQRSIVTFGDNDSPLAVGDSLEPLQGRGGKISFQHGSMLILVRNPQLNGTFLRFGRMVDTVGTFRRLMFESATSTQPFEGAGRLEFAVTYNGRGTIPVGAELRLGLVDAQSGQLVLPLGVFSGTADTTASFSVLIALPGQIQIRVLAQGIPNNAFYTMERWLYPQDEADAAQLVSSLANNVGDAAGKQLPATFAFHPNHPNPFNPATQIRFDLPEPSNVSLVIYDILGRQVTELVNGEYEAGYHSVTWNASSFASGVYLARFVASDASGALRLSTTQKLVLTK